MLYFDELGEACVSLRLVGYASSMGLWHRYRYVWVQGEEHPDYSKACVRAHNGAIISLQRSPFFEDVLLTVGDWSCALWKEGQHQSPLFTSPHAPAPYTAGCWSPTRPGTPAATNRRHCQPHLSNPSNPFMAAISLSYLCCYALSAVCCSPPLLMLSPKPFLRHVPTA